MLEKLENPLAFFVLGLVLVVDQGFRLRGLLFPLEFGELLLVLDLEEEASGVLVEVLVDFPDFELEVIQRWQDFEQFLEFSLGAYDQIFV